MKRLLLAVLLAASSACRSSAERAPAATDFYGELAPYGQWVELDPYGVVWRPSDAVVGADFYPYFTGGWWESTSWGWSWQSAWSWGWIPFHHGRWVDAPSHGWVWVPGDEWAPAWVEWRVGGGNVGWVPLGPQGVATVFVGYHPRWCFVPLAQFPRRDFARWRLPAFQEYSAYHSATSIPFERGDGKRGPSLELVQRAGGPVTRAAEPPHKLRRGDVRAESRVGPAAKVPGKAKKAAPSPEAKLPPPPPTAASKPGQTQAMPPPPPAAAPALKSGKKQSPVVERGRGRKRTPERPALPPPPP